MSEIVAGAQRVSDILGEISAAAAESLKDQAQRLAQLVAMFRFGDAAVPNAA